MLRKTISVGLFASVVAMFAAKAEPASACGGFFCSRTPVDQTAERIIFAVDEEEATVTAYIQISYSGDRDDFAWIIPLPAAPELDVFSQLAFQGLDLATEPQYSTNSCYVEAPSAGGGEDDGGGSNGGVTIIAREEVGPYDTVTLEGDSADRIVEWLQNNDFRINDSMRPYIDAYVNTKYLQGSGRTKFVAMKLLPDAEVSDIQPVSMKYRSNRPLIPIQLTTVAAQPEMGLKVWILANERWAPANYRDIEIPDELIRFDPYGYRNNYLSVVSREVDAVGGQAFVTEYAGPASVLEQQFRDTPVPVDNQDAIDANDALIELMGNYRYVTRLYSRMAAEEMTVDPYFKVASKQDDVSNLHYIETDPDVDTCSDPPEPAPCDFTYCGRSGACTEIVDSETDALMAVCACKSGSTARPTVTAGDTSQFGVVAPELYCEPVSYDFSAPGEADGFSDPCDGFSCGSHGECITMNGNPTCNCEAGYGAAIHNTWDSTNQVLDTSITCEEVDVTTLDFPTLPPIPAGPTSPKSESSSKDSGGCALARKPARGSSDLGFAALLGLSAFAAWSRRGRRAPRTPSNRKCQ
jgi:hypothetical protein